MLIVAIYLPITLWLINIEELRVCDDANLWNIHWLGLVMYTYYYLPMYILFSGMSLGWGFITWLTGLMLGMLFAPL